MVDTVQGAAWSTLGDLTLPDLDPLPGPMSAEVCVVGLGASGLAAAAALAQRGADVVAVDTAGIAAGAAGRNGGFLLAGLARFHHDAVAAYGRARAVSLYRLTLDELDRAAAESPDGVVRRVGSLRIGASGDEAADCARHLAALRADGLPVEAYDGPEGHGLLVPSDAAVHPVARCAALADRALAVGARLHAPCHVTGVGPGVVEAAGGDIRADRVVVAVDGGLEDLFGELAGRVRTARLQMLATAPESAIAVAASGVPQVGLRLRPAGAFR